MLVAHNHASQQHTTNNNNTPEGRPAVMEGGANVGGVNNDVGEGGSPVVTDPSAESGAAAAAAAAGGGGEDDSPVLGGVVGDGTSPTTTVHSQNGTPFTVTVVPAKAGQQAKRSWIWQVMHEFFSYRRRKKRPLFRVQTLVGLESEERNERHDQALQDQPPNTVQSDHGGGHHHRCSEGQSHPGHR